MKRTQILFAALLISLCACSAAIAKGELSISPSMINAVQMHMNTSIDNEATPLSMDTKESESLVKELWRIAGTTPETHPTLYRDLRYAARHDQKHGGPWRTSAYDAENPLGYTEDIQQITSLTEDEEGNIVASAYYSAVESNLVSGTISLQIWGYKEGLSWQPISNATTLKVDEHTCSNILDLSNTVSSASLPEDGYLSYRAQLHWTVTDSLNRTTSGSLTLTNSALPRRMSLEAPAPINGNDYIKVCMNRVDRHAKDCDYVINSEKEIVAFPLKGSVAFSGPIWAPGEKPGYDPVVDIKTVKLPLGGGCELSDLEKSFWDLPGVNVDGSRVSWDISPEEFQETQKTCFGYGDQALFSMNISAYLRDKEGQDSAVAASFSNNQNTRVGAATMKMDPMKVYYGCLAEGTEVTVKNWLGFGERKQKIESQSLIGKTALNRKGIRDLIVAGNAYGFEADFMLEVSTSNERSVTLTQDHPIWVNGEFKSAIDVKLKDKVLTGEGEEIVTGLRLIDPGEDITKVWNIFLERPSGLGVAPINERGFYANDILVGDGSVQEYNMLWAANAACRAKKPRPTLKPVTEEIEPSDSDELQPVVSSANWDEATGNTVVKWTVKNPKGSLYSFIITTRTGTTQNNVGEVPKTQLCAEFSARDKPDTVIVTGTQGSGQLGLPSNPPTPVKTGQDSCDT